MDLLTERLEVRVSERTIARVREEARIRGVSVGRLVREALARLVEEDTAERVRAAEALFALEAPVADWPEMEREIEAARAEQVVP